GLCYSDLATLVGQVIAPFQSARRHDGEGKRKAARESLSRSHRTELPSVRVVGDACFVQHAGAVQLIAKRPNADSKKLGGLRSVVLGQFQCALDQRPLGFFYV